MSIPIDDLVGRLFATAEGFGRKTLLEDNGEVIPLWSIVCDDDSLEVIGTPWQDETEKVMALLMIKAALRSRRARAYSILSEVWTATWDKDQPKTWKVAGEAPHKKEAMMIIVVTPERHDFKAWEIKRDIEGRCIALVPVDMPAQSTSGRMTELFEGL